MIPLIPTWFDISTPTPDRLRGFYSALFGWAFTTVEDVPDALSHAVELGGTTLLEPTATPMGRIAAFADPDGKPRRFAGGMMRRPNHTAAADTAWALVHAERAALAADLADLTDDQWATTSLCTELSVREVLAHLTAGAVLSFPRWFSGVLRTRFDFDKQLVDRLREQLGNTPEETLARFRAAVNRSTTPLGRRGSAVGALAEQVVHDVDIRTPLGIHRVPPIEVLVPVAEHYASTDLVVLAKGRIGGLQLIATDSDFTTGTGSEVRGPTLALIMAMTGRGVFCDELTGTGVEELRSRC